MGITSYRFSNINLGGNKKKFGHAVYRNASYKIATDDSLLKFRYKADKIRIIFKENKYHKPEFSVLEVAFSELAHLFLEPDITPKQLMVKDDDGLVLGSASEYMTYTIARHEPASVNYFHYQEIDGKMIPIARRAVNTDEIPFHFFNNLPAGMFKQLIDDEKANKVSINYGSLASVLTSSYTLEEDDLHKGNFGFYAIKKEGKPHIVFFKIDHDLMLTDSVMSHHTLRVQDFLNGKDAFCITERDLLNFPNIVDSKNFYWPTITRTIHGTGNKAYTDDAEIETFSNLAKSKEFCKYKWQEFYKHVLIPPELISQSLANHLDLNDPQERANCALITQSVVARQAKLRAVLFSIREFREFVLSMDEATTSQLTRTILQSAHRVETELLTKKLESQIAFHQLRCDPNQANAIVEGDTPLHVAIRLQDFRYHDTWDSFSTHAEQENASHQKPLDVVLALQQEQQRAKSRIDNPCSNAQEIMAFMLQQGTTKTRDYYLQQTLMRDNLSADDRQENPYVLLAKKANDINGLIKILRNLSEDYSYCLKMKKNIAIEAVKQFIEAHREDDLLLCLLKELKMELNGKGKRPPAPELQFIRQLRSQLWLVRYFRGMFGTTTTLNGLNTLIDKEIRCLEPCCTFFSMKRTPAKENHREKVAEYPMMEL